MLFSLTSLACSSFVRPNEILLQVVNEDDHHHLPLLIYHLRPCQLGPPPKLHSADEEDNLTSFRLLLSSDEISLKFWMKLTLFRPQRRRVLKRVHQLSCAA